MENYERNQQDHLASDVFLQRREIGTVVGWGGYEKKDGLWEKGWPVNWRCACHSLSCLHPSLRQPVLGWQLDRLRHRFICRCFLFWLSRATWTLKYLQLILYSSTLLMYYPPTGRSSLRVVWKCLWTNLYLTSNDLKGRQHQQMFHPTCLILYIFAKVNKPHLIERSV